MYTCSYFELIILCNKFNQNHNTVLIGQCYGFCSFQCSMRNEMKFVKIYDADNRIP